MALEASIVVLDAITGVVVDVTPSLAEFLGYTREELVGRRLVDLAPFRHASPGDLRLCELGDKGFVRCDDLPLEKRDGTRINVDLLAEPSVGNTLVRCSVRELSERERTERGTARQDGLLDQLLTTIPDNIYFKDRESRFIRINDAMARWVGLGDPQEAVGRTDADFFGEAHAREAHADEQHVMATGEPIVGLEERETWPDGRVTWVSSSKVPIRDESGRVVGLVGVSRDITEHKRLEEQARLSQRMEAIGRLAGGVAHDFNNLLGIIIGYGERVLGRLPGDDPVHGDQMELLNAAHRAAELTHQLLAFGRLQVLQPKVLDLNGVVSEMDKMLRRLIGEHFVLDTLLEPGLGMVWADPGQTGQILMNLVVNARDAMPTGGRLTIETKNVELDATHAASYAMTRPGRYVLLAVTDTGSGIDAETQAHIFEPFFTTKDLGKGTGLGLSTVYGIVKQSGGFIWVYSEPGFGSTFKVYLPRIDGDLTIPPRDSAPTPIARGTETVVLIEDETSLRNVVRDTLEENGYTVLVAGSGAEAVQLADAHEGSIHLLLTDVIMPGMSGREAATAIGATRTGMKVLFISGYTQDAINRHGELLPGVAFLSKPFTAAALLRKCREVLATGRG
jgi:PAS domain S-box-containing protein